MKEVIPNAIFGMAKTAANIVGSEPKVTVSEHSIDIEFVEPKDTESYVWEDMYENGAIYLKGKANPIKIDTTESDSDDVEFATTDYFKSFMKQDVINSALTAGGVDKPLLVKLQMATIGAILIMAFVMKV